MMTFSQFSHYHIAKIRGIQNGFLWAGKIQEKTWVPIAWEKNNTTCEGVLGLFFFSFPFFHFCILFCLVGPVTRTLEVKGFHQSSKPNGRYRSGCLIYKASPRFPGVLGLRNLKLLNGVIIANITMEIYAKSNSSLNTSDKSWIAPRQLHTGMSDKTNKLPFLEFIDAAHKHNFW